MFLILTADFESTETLPIKFLDRIWYGKYDALFQADWLHQILNSEFDFFQKL